MRLAGAAASGRATLRRSGEIATLAGALSVEPALVRRAGFSGRIGARLEFASTGTSLAALMAGLAGGGTVDFVGASLARSDPAALERVVAAAQAPDAQIDETNIAYQLGAGLDKGALAIPDGSTPVALSAGTLKLGPLAIAEGRAEARLTASLELVQPALETRLQLTAPATGLKFWVGPPPSALVTVENALDAPKRRIDVAGLSAGLATQAIARESDRIANLDADIRERAFFNRRLKGERFLDRRKEEIEDWRAEQERLKGLSQHLAEQREEERLAAAKAAAEKARRKRRRPRGRRRKRRRRRGSLQRRPRPKKRQRRKQPRRRKDRPSARRRAAKTIQTSALRRPWRRDRRRGPSRRRPSNRVNRSRRLRADSIRRLCSTL